MSKNLPFLLLATAACSLAAEPFALVGTVTNTTNPNQTITADLLITFDQNGNCVLKVALPLYGSGTCKLKAYDQSTGHIEITSEGALINITATGTVNAGTVTGEYKVEAPSTPELPQFGSFQLRILSGIQKPLQLSDVLSWETFKSGDQEFLIIRDGSVVSVHHKDGKYAGRRAFLDAEGKPTVIIDDSGNVSVYRDFKTNQIMFTWVKGPDNGVFVKESSGVNQYLDRFLQPTGWWSVPVNQQTIFVHEVNGDVELYDSSLQPLGIRSGKTPSGKLYWTRTIEGYTQFLDESFKPLGWYSKQDNGRTIYAQVGRNKVIFYDENLKQLHVQRTGFWANFGKGVATGLAILGSAAQGAAAAYNQAQQGQSTPEASSTSYNSAITPNSGFTTTNTTDSQGHLYSTTSQQVGNFTYSNTIGSNGYLANSTTQRVGTFDYISGSSNNGSYSGTRQRIGNFDYTNLATPSGSWTGTSTSIGNFTYHNFTGPSGQAITGTSMKVGDFIYTTTH